MSQREASNSDCSLGFLFVYMINVNMLGKEVGFSPKGVSLEGTICLHQNIPVNQGHKTLLVRILAN